MAIDHEFSCNATTNVTGENTYTHDMEETYGNPLAIREKYHQKVLKNIERAQQRQKAQYNAKHGTLHVWVIMVLILKRFEILLRVLALVQWPMVMLKNMRNSHRMGGKLDKKWIGPYEVVESLSNGCYRLKSSDGSIFKKAYNSFLLKDNLQLIEVGICSSFRLLSPCTDYMPLSMLFRIVIIFINPPKFRMEHRKSVSQCVV